MKVAVIVNDMGELNIDAALISSSRLVQAQEKLVSLSNGCICCTLREDLLEEVLKLAKEGKFDYLVIESTGISEPMQVAETFAMHLPASMVVEQLATGTTAAAANVRPDALGEAAHDIAMKSNRQTKRQRKLAQQQQQQQQQQQVSEQAEAADADVNACSGQCLSHFARLDTCVTVVDAATFLDNLQSIEELADRYGSKEVPEGDDRSIACLLMEQVEFADVILLNKVDLLTQQAAQTAVSQPAKRHTNGSKSSSKSTGRLGKRARQEAGDKAGDSDAVSSKEGAEKLALVRMALKKINPCAEIIECEKCEVPLSSIINTGRFDLEKATQAPGWMQAIKAGEQPTPETEEYGVGSFVYRARRPFHPGRLFHSFLKRYFLTRVSLAEPNETDQAPMDAEESEGTASDEDEGETSDEACDLEAAAGINEHADPLVAYEEQRQKALSDMWRDIGNVLRSKGWFWVATCPEVLEWSHAGVVLHVHKQGPWFADIPEEDWPEDENAVAQIRSDFHPTDPAIGDRRQELVFIGQNLKRDAITAALDACLATAEEAEEGRAGRLEDPLLGLDDADE